MLKKEKSEELSGSPEEQNTENWLAGGCEVVQRALIDWEYDAWEARILGHFLEHERGEVPAEQKREIAHALLFLYQGRGKLAELSQKLLDTLLAKKGISPAAVSDLRIDHVNTSRKKHPDHRGQEQFICRLTIEGESPLIVYSSAKENTNIARHHANVVLISRLIDVKFGHSDNPLPELYQDSAHVLSEGAAVEHDYVLAIRMAAKLKIIYSFAFCFQTVIPKVFDAKILYLAKAIARLKNEEGQYVHYESQPFGIYTHNTKIELQYACQDLIKVLGQNGIQIDVEDLEATYSSQPTPQPERVSMPPLSPSEKFRQLLLNGKDHIEDLTPLEWIKTADFRPDFYQHGKNTSVYEEFIALQEHREELRGCTLAISLSKIGDGYNCKMTLSLPKTGDTLVSQEEYYETPDLAKKYAMQTILSKLRKKGISPPAPQSRFFR